ncbi:hypothetical protein [Salipiger mucosus]|uniref:Uncharacterized protein n=1 Tax=Salipiger mucosus DSM 16094 TaxID=1123237 RepID=S9QWC5_9RHOB|nr:hypothetical protein [Salipiger mucosus]EPX83902.1 hypothetical protein Salmuc_01677 [Salipiger mucosus DSM 16094]
MPDHNDDAHSASRLATLPFDMAAGARSRFLNFVEIGIEAIEALPDARNPVDFLKIQDRAAQRFAREATRGVRTAIGFQLQFMAGIMSVGVR